MSGITLAAVGDIMLGDHPVCFGHGIRSKIRRGREPLIDPALNAVLAQSDVLLGNLECVLSEIGHDPNKLKSSEMRGDRAALDLLKQAGFTTLNMANNHMLQHGVAAFQDTVEYLRSRSIEPVGLDAGSGASNVVNYEKDGSRLLVCGYSLRPEYFCKDNRYYARTSQEKILEHVSQLKSLYPDHARVVTLHWGEEYLHAPSSEQVHFAHQLIDLGATAIIGHHPHVLQGIEEYRSGLIAYSLGNFVFDSWQDPTRESAILQCQFRDGALTGYSMVPVEIDRSYSVKLAGPARARELSNKIARYSRLITENGAPVSLEAGEYDRLAQEAYLRYRMQCYFYFVTHLWKYPPKVIGDSFLRAFLRRLPLA